MTLDYCPCIVSGRRKSQIVFNIFLGNDRFHLLQEQLPGISETVLARQLKELEHHAIVVKKETPDTVSNRHPLLF